MRIGIDFDNTLVSYERAFSAVGREKALLPPDFAGGKEEVKAFLLKRSGGDPFPWEKLQGLVYGRMIERAELFEGVAEFLLLCSRRKDIEVFIVSHKTPEAHHDPVRTNLRNAAIAWMRARHFFDQDRFGLKIENVFFEGTRDEKIWRIAALACDIFIDDLPEVLEHADMPKLCRKILFRGEVGGPFECATTWYDIRDAVFSRSRSGT